MSSVYLMAGIRLVISGKVEKSAKIRSGWITIMNSIAWLIPTAVAAYYILFEFLGLGFLFI